MQCEKCGFEQEAGKFCGKCGEPLDASRTEQTNETNTVEQSTASIEEVSSTVEQTPNTGQNDTLEKVKETATAYGTYFLHYLKQPSLVFSKGKTEFKNGIINNVLLVILLSLTIYFIGKDMFYYFSYSESVFLPVFGKSLIFLVALLAIIMGLIFITIKFFGKEHHFKEIVGIYGVHMIPVNIVIVVTLILSLLSAYGSSVFLLSLTMTLITVIMPLHIVSKQLTKDTAKVDPLYGYLLYLVFFGVVVFIFSTILIDTGFGEIIRVFGLF